MVKRSVLIIIGATVGCAAVIGLTIGLLVWGLTKPDSEERPLVSTNLGSFRGLWSDDGEYSKFLGVSFAVVDERNPFGPAIPTTRFEGVFDASTRARLCPQMRQGVPTGDIQCLELDIYVPESASTDNPLPVLVWIYGEAWVEGSTEREGTASQFLTRHDVIFVAINYRLGIYGFLCADIPEAPGNLGLKDQVLALRWINENIQAFGGDVNRITLMGNSAGAMSANLHLYSPHEKLFNSIIVQSGPALSYWAMLPSHPEVPSKLAEYFNYNASDASEALTYLSSLDPLTVVEASYDLRITDIAGLVVTKPCVEISFPGVEPFLVEHPMNIRGAPKVASTNILIGTNDQEFGFMYSYTPDFFDSYHFREEFEMGFRTDEDLDVALDKVRHFYLGDNVFSVNVTQEIVNYGSDIIFEHSTYRMIRQLLDDGAGRIFRYVFSYEGGRNMQKVNLNVDVQGAQHADELGYLFDLEMFENEPSAADQLVIDRITTLWTNFAKYGDPTPQTSELLPLIWPPVNSTRHPYLEINSELTLGSRPSHARMAFWTLFYKTYGQHQFWYQG